MFRIAIFLLVLFSLAIGFAWLADNNGSVTVQWDWWDAQNAYEVTLLQAMIALAAIVALVMMVWWVVSAVLNSPESFGRWRSGRRRDKGYSALSKGLVAAGAGNAPLARRLSRESGRYLDNEPLVKLLDAQTALLEGKHEEARTKFETMLESEDTRLLGLRGLHTQAEAEGNGEAAAHFAREAYNTAPETPWAALGLLKSQGSVGDWNDALKTLESNRVSGFYSKEEYNRKRAVILTALAQQLQDQDPDKARSHALSAHKLAPSLVPAAIIGAQLSNRLGDMRKAAKILETTWKLEPHPEIAEDYAHLRNGDSALDRLKRAENLANKRSSHPEGQFAIANAAIDAGEWQRARDAIKAVLHSSPTERACLLMADIEEAEHGDRGRVREWLARAVTAPRDHAWTAGGVTSEKWAPISPVTGELDAFRWMVPVEELGGSSKTLDYSPLPPHAEALPDKDVVDEPSLKETGAKVIANAATAAAVSSRREQEPDAGPIDPIAASKLEVEDAVVLDEVEDKSDTGGDAKDTKAAVITPDSEKATGKSKSTASAKSKKATAATGATSGKKTPKKSGTDAKTGTDKGAAVPAGADTSSKEEPSKKSNSASKPLEHPVSPFKVTDHDADGDGQIDHRPDDPGPRTKPKKKKNFFF